MFTIEFFYNFISLLNILFGQRRTLSGRGGGLLCPKIFKQCLKIGPKIIVEVQKSVQLKYETNTKHFVCMLPYIIDRNLSPVDHF